MQAQGDAFAVAAALQQFGQAGDVVVGGEVQGEGAGVVAAGFLQGVNAVGDDAQAVFAAVIVAADAAFGNQHLVGAQGVAAELLERFAANHHFGLAAGVFQRDEGDFAAFAHHASDGGGEAGHAHVVVGLELGEAGGGELAHFFFGRAEGVAGKIEADGLFFFGQKLGFAPGGHVDHFQGGNRIFHHIEQAALIGIFFLLLGVAHGQVDVGKQAGAVGLDAVERAAAHQGFDGAAVDVLAAHALAEVEQALERAAFFAGGHNGFHRGFAGAFNRAQGVADAALGVGLEVVAGMVDIGRQEADAVVAGIVVEQLELVGVVQFARHGGGHEFGRIVGFEPGGLVGHQGVGGGMGFVEAVAGEFFHVVEDFIGFFAGNALFGRTFGEDFAVFRHFFGLLLAHGTA